MWVPALPFLLFPPLGCVAGAQLCVSSVNALSRIQLPTHWNSGCQFSSLNYLRSCLLVYLLHFQVIFFTYYLFLTAAQWVLSEAALVTVTQQNPNLGLVFLLLCLLCDEDLKTSGFGRMVTFVFPHSSHGLCLLPGSNHGNFHGEKK